MARSLVGLLAVVVFQVYFPLRTTAVLIDPSDCALPPLGFA
jgi:hypothetical protein